MKPLLLLLVALVPVFLSLQLVKSDVQTPDIPAPRSNSSTPGPSDSASNVTSNATPTAVNTTTAPSVTSNATASIKPTTTAQSTAASKPTSPSKDVTTEVAKPTPAKSTVTVATPKPVLPSVSVTVTPKAAAAQVSSSSFSAGSFIGGIVLTLGLLAIGYVGCRTYHAKRGVQYRTIDEHDAII